MWRALVSCSNLPAHVLALLADRAVGDCEAGLLLAREDVEGTEAWVAPLLDEVTLTAALELVPAGKAYALAGQAPMAQVVRAAGRRYHPALAQVLRAAVESGTAGLEVTWAALPWLSGPAQAAAVAATIGYARHDPTKGLRWAAAAIGHPGTLTALNTGDHGFADRYTRAAAEGGDLAALLEEDIRSDIPPIDRSWWSQVVRACGLEPVAQRGAQVARYREVLEAIVEVPSLVGTRVAEEAQRTLLRYATAREGGNGPSKALAAAQEVLASQLGRADEPGDAQLLVVVAAAALTVLCLADPGAAARSQAQAVLEAQAKAGGPSTHEELVTFAMAQAVAHGGMGSARWADLATVESDVPSAWWLSEGVGRYLAHVPQLSSALFVTTLLDLAESFDGSLADLVVTATAVCS